MKVLDSCENPCQIETAERLFKLYLKMWEKELTDSQVKLFVNNFEKEKKGKSSKVVRKSSSFFSKISQFFIF